MNLATQTSLFGLALALASCVGGSEPTAAMKVYETSRGGHALTEVQEFESTENPVLISVHVEEAKQIITGFGGAFTEASAHLLNQLSEEKREQILRAYFSDEGAKYSLMRTHMNSCDFSLSNYSYTPVEGDVDLEHFTIEEDRDDLIPMIKGAQSISTEGFKLFASPWTAAPWMKDNNHWVGGK